MPEDSSDKYYQNNKEILQKNLMKYIAVFLKKKKKKATIWSLTIQKFTRRRKTKAC